VAVVFVLAFQTLFAREANGSADLSNIRVMHTEQADTRSPAGLAPAPAPPALTVAVTGRRWFWDLEYPAYDFFTADELYIPVGEPVLLEMTSATVPHTWWPPREGDSRTIGPTEQHYSWLYATEPGTYDGVCTEACDDPTAYMPLRIFAVEPAVFEDWVAQQTAPVPEPQDPLAVEGEQLMQNKACLGCHALGETNTHIRVGPNLTNMARRSRIAGVVPYSTENMRAWLADPTALKPGTTMPRLNLSEEEVEALAAYLDTLR
jgi:cytochrome c oxidase subunit 2